MTDIKAIWKRLRKKIDLGKIKGLTPKQWKKNFVAELKKSGPQTKNLDKVKGKGFYSRAERLRLFPKQSVFIQRYDGKTAVLTGKGKTKLFKSKNVRITESTYKGERAVYISNKKTGKRITMRLVGNGIEKQAEREDYDLE